MTSIKKLYEKVLNEAVAKKMFGFFLDEKTFTDGLAYVMPATGNFNKWAQEATELIKRLGSYDEEVNFVKQPARQLGTNDGDVKTLEFLEDEDLGVAIFHIEASAEDESNMKNDGIEFVNSLSDIKLND